MQVMTAVDVIGFNQTLSFLQTHVCRACLKLLACVYLLLSGFDYNYNYNCEFVCHPSVVGATEFVLLLDDTRCRLPTSMCGVTLFYFC